MESPDPVETLAARRRREFHANPDDPRHGSLNGYTNHGCRCGRCRTEHANHHRGYMQRSPDQQFKNAQRERDRRSGYYAQGLNSNGLPYKNGPPR